MAMHSTTPALKTDGVSFVKRAKRLPALLALGIQIVSCLFVIVFVWLFYAVTLAIFDVYLVLPMLLIICLQGVMAQYLAQKIGMAVWWRWIHLCFPFAVWTMLQINLPNELYLIGFVVSLSVFWSTFKTQVPYYPSRRNVWQQVSKLIENYQDLQSKPMYRTRVIDIGSGLGGCAMYLANTHPDAQVEGIEVAPLPWLASVMSALLKRSTARFKLGNYHQLNFLHYDIIFAYLSPAAMDELWQKAANEMRQGCLLISLEFEIIGIQPTQHILKTSAHPDIYIYKI